MKFLKYYFIGFLLILLFIISGVCVSFQELADTFSNFFNVQMICVFSTIFLILSLNEVSITENGYEKRYRFTVSILFVSLLSMGGQVAILTGLVGTIAYLAINTIKEHRFSIYDSLLKICDTLITVILMSWVFIRFGGESGKVSFPLNFILIIIAGIINYIIHTSIRIADIYIQNDRSRKPFFQLLYREFGWILKYDIWQALFSVLFYNSAVVFLYDNWDGTQTGSQLITPDDYLYFLIWVVIMAVIFYIPLRERLSSFKTFISYNDENVRNVIQDMQEGICILDNESRVKNFNRSAEKISDGVVKLQKGLLFREYFLLLKEFIEDGEHICEKIITAVEGGFESFKLEMNIIKPVRKYYNLTHTSENNRFGEKTGSVITIEDITVYKSLINEINIKNEKLEQYRIELENRLTELRETQEQLIISEKMAVIGQLVAGVAHEINTPLASIKANVDLEKMIIPVIDTCDAEVVKSMLDNLMSMNDINVMALDRIMGIVKNLKNFARLDESELKQVNIHEGLDSTVALIGNQLKNGILLIKNYSELPDIFCYPQQLNQVFLNILVNSVQAIENKGEITITTWFNDNKIFISFRDTGIGIKPETLQRIFDPGFTTKGVGVGTGLGLSISYKIIEKHKGKITVNSTVGVGTEFVIELPVEGI
jgi:signal transduction histidine kinase